MIFGVAAGLLAGSFIATVVVRWPRGQSALAGRSRCDSCGATVAMPSLVPLLSYVLLRGRSRCCGTRIDPIHPVVEAAAATIGGISALVSLPQAIASAWLGWTLLALAMIDVRAFRLPSPIVATVGITGLATALWLHEPTPTDSLIGACAGFISLEAVRLVYRAIRHREGIGAGDPKMFGALGAWVGWEQLPLTLLTASLIGLAWAAAIRVVGQRIGWSDRMPLGTLLAIAAWPIWLLDAAAMMPR